MLLIFFNFLFLHFTGVPFHRCCILMVATQLLALVSESVSRMFLLLHYEFDVCWVGGWGVYILPAVQRKLAPIIFLATNNLEASMNTLDSCQLASTFPSVPVTSTRTGENSMASDWTRVVNFYPYKLHTDRLILSTLLVVGLFFTCKSNCKVLFSVQIFLYPPTQFPPLISITDGHEIELICTNSSFFLFIVKPIHHDFLTYIL